MSFTSWSFLLFPVAKWILEGVVTPSAGFGVIVSVVKLYLLEEQLVIREGE